MPNLLNIGIDISSLETQKEQAIVIVKDLFAQLSQLDNAKVSPIDISGLTALNKSVTLINTNLSKTQQLLANVVGLMAQFNAQNTLNGTGSSSGTSKAKTVATDEWIAKMKEANAVAKAVAKEQIDLEKAEAAAVVEAEKQKAAAVKESIAIASAAEKERQVLLKQTAAINAQQAKTIQSSIDQQIVVQKRKEKEDIQEAKNMMLLNDQYRQLILRRKELEFGISQTILSGGQGKPYYKAQMTELSAVNNAVANVDNSLEKAGSGGAKLLGKELTGALSALRNIAYILPGIGIAGIFNLAFIAVENFIGSADNAADRIKTLTGLNKDLNSALQAQEDVYQKISDITYSLYQNNPNTQKASQFLLNQSQAQGQNQQTQLSLQNTIASQNPFLSYEPILGKGGDKAFKESLDQSITNINQLNNQVQNTARIVDAMKRLEALGLKDVVDIKFRAEHGAGTLEGVGNQNRITELARIVAPSLNNSKFQTIETAQSFLEKQKSDLQLAQKDADDKLKILNGYYAAKNQLEVSSDALNKYLSDEERKRLLDKVKEEVEIKKNENSIIISNQLSTEAQIKSAIDSNLTQDIRLADSQKQDVIKNISSSGVDKINAELDYNSSVKKLTENSQQQIEKVQKDFLEKRLQFLQNASRDEITLDQLKNEKIFKDDEQSYTDRFDALVKYLEDRKNEIEKQYQFDLLKAERETPADLLPAKKKELTSSRDKQLFEATQGTKENVVGIVDSFYKDQLKKITDSYNDQLYVSKEKETEELEVLNDSYDKKILSYRKYAIKKKQIEQEFLVKTDDEEIQRDTDALNKLISLRNDLNSKTNDAGNKLLKAKASGNQDESDKAQNEIDQLQKDTSDVNNKIDDKNQELQNDRLKKNEDSNNKQIKDTSTFRLVLIKVYDELLNDVKNIVDSEYEYRLEAVQRNIELYDKQVDAEKEAIDRSSLNQKDKVAYEVQLEAQKAAADKVAADKEKKIRHDEALFNRDIDIAQIILNTELGISSALAKGGLGIPSAIAIGILGAAALATALAVKIPSYGKGGVHKGGLALYGEAGAELVKEPGKEAFVAVKPTLGFLKSGTELIPLYSEPAVAENKYKDTSWEQTKYLAGVIKKGNKNTQSTIHNHIKIDLGFTNYKNNILHG